MKKLITTTALMLIMIGTQAQEINLHFDKQPRPRRTMNHVHRWTSIAIIAGAGGSALIVNRNGFVPLYSAFGVSVSAMATCALFETKRK